MEKITVVGQLFDRIDIKMKQPSTVKELERILAKFVDRHAELLSATGPMKLIGFNRKEQEEIYNALDMTEDMFITALKNSTYIENHWQVAQNPLYLACTLMIRSLLLQNKLEKAQQINFILLFAMYPTMYKKYFKYNPQEQIMNYTIANLSNKFNIKTFSSIYGMYSNLSVTCLNAHIDRLRKGDDVNIVRFINDMHSRINDSLKNIANAYYENHKSGNYMNVDQDVNDDDNFIESDNVSFAIAKIVQKNVSIFEMNGPNYKRISHCAKVAGTSVNELRNHILMIYNGKYTKDYEKIVDAILQIYLFETKKSVDSIKSWNFVTDMIAYYGKMTKTDQNLNTIKNKLNYFLDESGMTKRVKRPDTLNSQKKAILLYILFSIQDNK